MRKIFTYATLFMLCCVAILGTSCSSGGDEPEGGNGSDPTPPSYSAEGNSMVIYEANPLFFANNNCFNAIDARLGDINAMGANVLWLMPINTLGSKNAIGSPYCIQNYEAINPKYGDMASLKKLVTDAHNKGMKVIIDWVANHTAWDNVWITAHPDWYVKDASGNIIDPPGMGWKDVAELNYNNADMRKAMIAAMLYWIKEAGIDGFRCDYAEGVPNDFWRQAIDAIRAVKSDALMLAEASNMDMYANGFNMIYDWSYCTDLQKYFKGSMTFEKLWQNTLDRQKKIPAGKEILRYVVNHDVISEQSPVQLYGSNDAIEPAYVITAFLSEVPLLYSGMEAGFTKATAFINASPLTWKPELVAKYDAIGKAYKNTQLARGGDLTIYNISNDVAAFAHTNGDKQVLVLANRSKSEITIKTPMSFVGKQMTDQLTGQTSAMKSVITLPAYGYAIYSK